jgi:DNA-binding IclR family transcriptional regulator
MNNTLHNGFRVLEFLADSGEAVSVKDIAEHFQLPNSHICRLLKSLTELGYAEQLAYNRKYRVSLKILNLANARLRKEHLLELSRSYMRQLAEKFSAPVYVTRIYCGYSLIIAVEYPALASSNSEVVIGALHSPTDSACGQVCAAFSPEESRNDLLNGIEWSKPGDFCNRRDEFEEELMLVRRRGWALRIRPDVGAVAVPLFENSDRITGALGIMLPPGRLDNEEEKRSIIETAVACGRLISIAAK